MTELSPQIVSTLRSLYGERLPTEPDTAFKDLVSRGVAPERPVAQAALREVLLAHAGQAIDGLEEAARRLTAHSRPSTIEARAPAAVVALQVAQLQGGRAGEARSTTGALRRTVSESELALLFLG